MRDKTFFANDRRSFSKIPSHEKLSKDCKGSSYLKNKIISLKKGKIQRIVQIIIIEAEEIGDSTN